MILVDINLLLATSMAEAPDHERAFDWWRERLNGSARVGLPWVCLTGFIRVAGQARAWERPLPVSEGLDIVRSWMARPCTWVPEPGPRHLELFADLLRAQPSARLATDAHLAALAIEHGLQLCSRDGDLARWHDQGLRTLDPVA